MVKREDKLGLLHVVHYFLAHHNYRVCYQLLATYSKVQSKIFSNFIFLALTFYQKEVQIVLFQLLSKKSWMLKYQ